MVDIKDYEYYADLDGDCDTCKHAGTDHCLFCPHFEEHGEDDEVV